MEGLTNPNEEVLDLSAGTVSASVTAAGDETALIGPADVEVVEGRNTIVYAWGSLDEDNLKLAVQTISGLHSNPDGVDAGQAGLAAAPSATLPLAALGLAGLTVTWALVRRRSELVRTQR